MREDPDMKRLAIIAAGGLLGGGCVFAEPRVFTNAEDETLKAPCFSAIDDKVVTKLKPMDVTLTGLTRSSTGSAHRARPVRKRKWGRSAAR